MGICARIAAFPIMAIIVLLMVIAFLVVLFLIALLTIVVAPIQWSLKQYGFPSKDYIWQGNPLNPWDDCFMFRDSKGWWRK